MGSLPPTPPVEHHWGRGARWAFWCPWRPRLTSALQPGLSSLGPHQRDPHILLLGAWGAYSGTLPLCNLGVLLPEGHLGTTAWVPRGLSVAHGSCQHQIIRGRCPRKGNWALSGSALRTITQDRGPPRAETAVLFWAGVQPQVRVPHTALLEGLLIQQNVDQRDSEGSKEPAEGWNPVWE